MLMMLLEITIEITSRSNILIFRIKKSGAVPFPQPRLLLEVGVISMFHQKRRRPEVRLGSGVYHRHGIIRICEWN